MLDFNLILIILTTIVLGIYTLNTKMLGRLGYWILVTILLTKILLLSDIFAFFIGSFVLLFSVYKNNKGDQIESTSDVNNWSKRLVGLSLLLLSAVLIENSGEKSNFEPIKNNVELFITIFLTLIYFQNKVRKS